MKRDRTFPRFLFMRRQRQEVRWTMNWKRSDTKRSLPNQSTHYHGISLARLWNVIKRLRQYRRCLGRDSNGAIPQYICRELQLQHCSATISSENKNPCISTTHLAFVTSYYTTRGPQATTVRLATSLRVSDRLQRFVDTRCIHLQGRLV